MNIDNQLTGQESTPSAASVPAIHPQTVMERLLIAATSGMDADTLEKFMNLAERNERREAEKAFHKAFAEFKSNPPKIVKDKLVSFGTTKYKHATIGSVVSAIIEGMSKYGLSHRWDILQDGANITVTCVITHFLGHSTATSLSAGADQSGGKNAIQAISSTVTYLERYTLQAATGIAVLEDDDDGRGAENIGHPKGKPGKQGQQQPKGQQTGGRQITAVDIGYLEDWLEWVDRFTEATLDQFNVQWEEHGIKAMNAMPDAHKEKMQIAKREMEKHLMEKKA